MPHSIFSNEYLFVLICLKGGQDVQPAAVQSPKLVVPVGKSCCYFCRNLTKFHCIMLYLSKSDFKLEPLY